MRNCLYVYHETGLPSKMATDCCDSHIPLAASRLPASLRVPKRSLSSPVSRYENIIAQSCRSELIISVRDTGLVPESRAFAAAYGITKDLGFLDGASDVLLMVLAKHILRRFES